MLMITIVVVRLSYSIEQPEPPESLANSARALEALSHHDEKNQ
jgi:hypothetical protein